MSYYCFDNYRTPEQLKEMQRLEAQGICLFCPDGLRFHAKQEALLRTRHWVAMPNEYPYEGTALHLLLVPGQHAHDMLDLKSDVLEDFWIALAAVRDRYGLTHYGLGVRNGDCQFTGATIRHVHTHIMVGTDDAAAPPVRMRFSSHPAEQRRC